MPYRKPSSTTTGGSFSPQTISAVWAKARVIPGVDPSRRRLDSCGAVIDYANYGVTVPNSTGWEIDHDKPVAMGGTDDLYNLQPLQWENNRRKSDSWPSWTCATRAA